MTMQPAELQALRNEARLTQAEFAAHMGVSRKTLNEMEGARAPIERRSMMAARQAFNEVSRLTSNHDVEPQYGDIPLAEAMFLWDREPQEGRRFIVVGEGKDDQRFSSSYGACNREWHAADDVGRLLRLFARSVEWTLIDRIDPTELHEALLVIPEYRRAVNVQLLDMKAD